MKNLHPDKRAHNQRKFVSFFFPFSSSGKNNFSESLFFGGLSCKLNSRRQMGPKRRCNCVQHAITWSWNRLQCLKVPKIRTYEKKVCTRTCKNSYSKYLRQKIEISKLRKPGGKPTSPLQQQHLSGGCGLERNPKRGRYGRVLKIEIFASKNGTRFLKKERGVLEMETVVGEGIGTTGGLHCVPQPQNGSNGSQMSRNRSNKNNVREGSKANQYQLHIPHTLWKSKLEVYERSHMAGVPPMHSPKAPPKKMER